MRLDIKKALKAGLVLLGGFVVLVEVVGLLEKKTKCLLDEEEEDLESLGVEPEESENETDTEKETWFEKAKLRKYIKLPMRKEEVNE